jgi:DNA invertase Pin-like site-specific DNA recombinase
MIYAYLRVSTTEQNVARQLKALKEYRDNLLELNEQFDEIRENVEEQVMEVFEAWNE